MARRMSVKKLQNLFVLGWKSFSSLISFKMTKISIPRNAIKMNNPILPGDCIYVTIFCWFKEALSNVKNTPNANRVYEA